MCMILRSPTSAVHLDILSLFIPTFQLQEFKQNPNEYVLKACGIESDIHRTRQHSRTLPLIDSSTSLGTSNITSEQQNVHFGVRTQKDRLLAKDQISLTRKSTVATDVNSINFINDNDIPDADELELSSLPLIQHGEFIDKIIHGYDTKHMIIPSPLILACAAVCGEKSDYEEIVKILLESHLVEFDGLNHECILYRILDYMHTKNYGSFQYVQVYRGTETEEPFASIFYQFGGFIVNQDAKPLSGIFLDSSITLNASRDDESVESDDDHQTGTLVSVRCFLTVLVLHDIFLAYPR